MLAVRSVISGLPTDMPGLGMTVTVSVATIATTVLLGVIAVGWLPLLHVPAAAPDGRPPPPSE